MARHFVNASFQYLERAGVPVAAPPLTISVWVTRTATLSGFGADLCATGVNAWFAMGANGSALASAYEYDGTNVGRALGSTIPVSTWVHLCGVFTTHNARSVFLNGTGKVTETTPTGAGSLNRTMVGAAYFAGTVNAASWDGDVAEFAIYNDALSDAEVAQLAAGARANTVRLANLVAYYPLLGTQDPEPDTMGGTSLTLVNGPTFAPHPPIFGSGAAGRMFQVF